MGFLQDLFGGSAKPPQLKTQDIEDAYRIAGNQVAPSDDELELLSALEANYKQADAGVEDEMARLRTRGDNLDTLDTDYFDRAFKPAYERLMQSYQDQDRGLMEDLNKRGIAAIPGGASEQESFMRDRLAESTKRATGQTMLEAQNQAVQQKLAQYNARLAETNQANTRYGQTFDPYYKAKVTPDSERMQTKAGIAGNIYNARLGQQSTNFQVNRQNQMDLLGAGVGAGSMLMASDVNVKKDFEPGNDPEQDLQDMTNIPVEKWHYEDEPSSAPMHTGGMAQDMPEDVSPDGKSVDIASYLGKTTNALKALNQRMSAFEQLMTAGGA